MREGESQDPTTPAANLRELVKSMLGFSWAMSLFGLRSLANLAAPSRAAASLDAVKQAAAGELGDGLHGAFEAADQVQRRVVDGFFAAVPGGGAGAGGTAAAGPGTGAGAGGPGAAGAGSQGAAFQGAAQAPAGPVASGSLDTATFVVLGEGLAAGAADFGTSADLQRESFPAQMARQMRTGLPQALLEPPGIGNLPGYAPLPVMVPALMQTTVVERLDLPTSGLGNLAVPGFRLADALNLRPAPPLVRRDDARQTAANLVLGMPGLLEGVSPLPTQLEAALARRPTFALVALGYLEAVEAVVAGDPGKLPSREDFRRDIHRLLVELRQAGAAVLVMNIPDPLDAACAVALEAAARTVKVPATILAGTYGLQPDDRITVRGLFEIGFQFLARTVGPLPAGAVLPAATAARIGERVGELNAELAGLAREHGAVLCDLHALWRTVGSQGLSAGSRQLTAEYLGGFYSLNGYYPGKTGHALIANEALRQLNQAFGAEFPPIDLGQVAASDPVVLYQAAAGPDITSGPAAAAGPLPGGASAGQAGTQGQGSLAAVAAGIGDAAAGAAASISADPVTGRAAAVRRQVGKWPQGPSAAGDGGAEGGAGGGAGTPRPIVLPPSLELVLPLNQQSSYFGDALRAVDCQDPREAQWGSCGGVLFGGLAMTDSHLSGQIRFRFSPPVGDVARFEMTVGELRGEDGILAAPQLYKLPNGLNSVRDYPGQVSWGYLHLSTGEVTGDGLTPEPAFSFSFSFANAALMALVRVNPAFPQVPISFPGQYGSAWGRFSQRADGQLDFEFFGSTFLPLGAAMPDGQPVRFPLPFAGATLQFASIPTRGVALHPHIHLSTLEPQPAAEDVPEVPTNTVRELTCFTHNTSFGDQFSLQGPFLGGDATGRSQLIGRIQVQFGERAGDSVPIYVSAMNPGGLLSPMAPSPLSAAFPGRLSPGPLGFNETLRFPLRSYSLDDVYLLSDPFDLSVAAVDVRSGAILGEQVHRGFIGQDLFFALLRVEPRTPKASFAFRGPAIFQKASHGQMVYRFKGTVDIPYPPGFLFPNPNLATGFPAGPGSALDPFFWVQAMDGGGAPPSAYVKQGGESDVLASTGDRFSYRYAIPADPRRTAPVFEYTNSSQKGSFRLQSVTWLHFGNARTAHGRSGEFDAVTFAGFGIWSKDGVEVLRPATVQISTAAGAPFVGIQIDGGAISNVNTKPATLQDAEP